LLAFSDVNRITSPIEEFRFRKVLTWVSRYNLMKVFESREGGWGGSCQTKMSYESPSGA